MEAKQPARRGRKPVQKPLFAKLPKVYGGGLFVKTNLRSHSKELGRLDIAWHGHVNGISFVVRLPLPLPQPRDPSVTVENASLLATGPHVLGAQELRVYQAVIGLALNEARTGSKNARITISTDSKEESMRLRADMGVGPNLSIRHDLLPEPMKRPLLAPAIVSLETTPNAIIEAAGLPRTRDSMETVIAALRALSAVTFSIQVTVRLKNDRVIVNEVASGMRMLTHQIVSDATPGGAIRHKVKVHFDPVVTEVLASLPQARYVLVPLDEMRQLHGEVATILHGRLCGVLDRGKHMRFTLTKLIYYVYQGGGEDGAAQGAMPKSCRKWVRAALEEIKKIGWKVVKLRELTRGADELYLIHRPAHSQSSEVSMLELVQAASGGEIVIREDAASLDPGEGAKD